MSQDFEPVFNFCPHMDKLYILYILRIAKFTVAIQRKQGRCLSVFQDEAFKGKE